MNLNPYILDWFAGTSISRSHQYERSFYREFCTGSAELQKKLSQSELNENMDFLSGRIIPVIMESSALAYSISSEDYSTLPFWLCGAAGIRVIHKILFKYIDNAKQRIRKVTIQCAAQQAAIKKSLDETIKYFEDFSDRLDADDELEGWIDKE